MLAIDYFDLVFLTLSLVAVPTFFLVTRKRIIFKQILSLETEIKGAQTSLARTRSHLHELEEIERLEKEKIAEERRQEEEKRIHFEREQEARGLEKFVTKYGKAMWGTPQQVEEWKRIEIGLENRFAEYSPREFEKFIARLFEKMGYRVKLGPYVADYGVDVMASKDDRRIIIQVKKYARGNLVGSKEVRSVLGAIWGKADKAILITTSDFTEHAYEQAKENPIELWNYRKLEEYVERYFVKTYEHN